MKYIILVLNIYFIRSNVQFDPRVYTFLNGTYSCVKCIIYTIIRQYEVLVILKMNSIGFIAPGMIFFDVTNLYTRVQIFDALNILENKLILNDLMILCQTEFTRLYDRN